MTSKVLLIGLSPVGASFGLALARAEGDVMRVGFDPDKKVAKRAKAAGAVDRTVAHPHQAAQSADLIIFDLPHHEVELYLENIRALVKSDAVIIDTAPVKAPFYQWAADHLPSNRNVIGATPIVGSLDPDGTRSEAAADRFAGGQLAITAAPNTPQDAMAVAINLARLLEAEPFFMDIDEHDAATAAVEDLPTLLSAAMFQASAHSPSWRELQRLAGVLFMESTELCSADPRQLQRRVSANRSKILARLDAFSNEVVRMRELLINEQDDDLMQYFKEADATRRAWLRARSHGDWASEEIRITPEIEGPRIIEGLLGIGRHRRKPEE
jgi:prephenate dehydrogenase